MRLIRLLGFLFLLYVFFFFQAEDGIRDFHVTGVQTCALPILLSHLPKKLHPSVAKMMRDAYRSRSKVTAKRRLQQLAAQLAADHPDAASSLKEGLDETLTLKGLGLPDWLERTLSSTNSIENVNGRMRAILRKVKRWRDGSMIKRWVATALLEAERGFRKVRGYKGMPILVAAIRGDAEQINRVDDQEDAA